MNTKLIFLLRSKHDTDLLLQQLVFIAQSVRDEAPIGFNDIVDPLQMNDANR
jgi:hypothetical protein